METPSIWLLTVAADGRIEDINPAAREALGDVRGRKCAAVMCVVDARGDSDCSQTCAARMVAGERDQLTRHARAARKMTGRVVCDKVGEHVIVSVQPIRSGQEMPTTPLSPREREILQLIAQGQTNDKIARRLGISASTVRTHVEHTCDKLAVRGRAAAVARAIANGEIEVL